MPGECQRPIRTVEDALDVLGAGPYEIIALVVGGGDFVMAGALMLLMTVVGKDLLIRWRLTPVEGVVIAVCIAVGAVVGASMGGTHCDRGGRRRPILGTYAGLAVSLLVAAAAPFEVIVWAALVAVMFFIGYGLPASNALVCESCPERHRSTIYSLTMVLLTLGQIYIALIVWHISPELDYGHLPWRTLFALAAALPAMFLLGAALWMYESPVWLAGAGRSEEASQVLIAIGSCNGATATLPEVFDTAAPTEATPLADNGAADEAKELEGCCASNPEMNKLCSEEYKVMTTVLCVIIFATHMVYYGLVYALPETLKYAMRNAGAGRISPAFGLLMSAVFELPGVPLAMFLGIAVSRRAFLCISQLGMAVCLGVTCHGLLRGDMQGSGMLGVLGAKVFCSAAFIVCCLYPLERYAPTIRASGLAFCVNVGRSGALFAPPIYEGILAAEVPRVWFFVILAAVTLFAAGLSGFLDGSSSAAKGGDVGKEV